MGSIAVKTVLVTGASGRLGRHVIPLLLERGYRVRAMVHRTTLPSEFAGEVETAPGDFADGAALTEAVQNVQAVCHFAALMPPSPDDDVFEVNVRGTYRLLEAVASCAQKPRFIFASTDATYCTGWSFEPYHSPIDENTPLRPVLFYGVSKVLGERMCVHFQDIHKIPVVRLRFDWILTAPEVLDIFVSAPYKDLLAPEDAGKWDDPQAVKIPLEENGQPFVEQVCDVRDSAQGALLAVEKEAAAGQVFNIAGPAPFTYSETGPKLAKRLGVAAVEGRCKGLYSYEISNEKARGLLGYRPRYSVLDSLEDALNAKGVARSAEL